MDSTWGRSRGCRPNPSCRCPSDYARLAATLRRALEELAEHYENVERRFDDAAWVGARLAELLPIELADKQALLETRRPDRAARRAADRRARRGPGKLATQGCLRCGTLSRAGTTSRAPTPSTSDPGEHHPADEAVVVAEQPAPRRVRTPLEVSRTT